MLPPSTVPARGPLPPDPDDAIRGTDDDAASSRLRVTLAKSLGYLEDPFLPLLYRSPAARKPPLINVGTHHRAYAIDKLVDRFLACGGRQVVSLGAGSDTRFWRIMSKAQRPNLRHYVEVDFPHLTALKAQRIARSPRLCSFLNASSTSTPGLSDAGDARPAAGPSRSAPYTVSKAGTQLSSGLYSLVPLDLRIPGALDELAPLLDATEPTLFLAECALCYMTPDQGEAIMSWFGRFDNCVGVVYEMCGLEDQFGAVMRRNLAIRNLSLPGAVFSDPQAQANRFTQSSLGAARFSRSGAMSLWDIRTGVIPKSELDRIAKLEHLDEIEELRLVLSHYCVAWGARGDMFEEFSLQADSTHA